MGTFGTGVFENDHAHDIFGDEVAHIRGQIDELLEDNSTGLDDIEGPLAFIEMLAVLGEHCDKIYLERSKLARWKQRYLEIYDAEIDELEPSPAYKEERRKVIEATFDRLGMYIRHALDPQPQPQPTVTLPDTPGSLNVTRAVPQAKMQAYKEEVEDLGASRGPTKTIQGK